MGKGIALQFKRAYPEMFRDYAGACKRGEVQLGKMHVWNTGQVTGPRFIINFPTKGTGSRVRSYGTSKPDSPTSSELSRN